MNDSKLSENSDRAVKEYAESKGKVADKIEVHPVRLDCAPDGFIEIIDNNKISLYKSVDGLSVMLTLEPVDMIHISVMRKSRIPEWKDIKRVSMLFIPKGIQPFIVLPVVGCSWKDINTVHIYFTAPAGGVKK